MKFLKGFLVAVCVVCFYLGYLFVGYSPLLFGTLELLSMTVLIILFWIKCNMIYVNGVHIRRIKK